MRPIYTAWCCQIEVTNYCGRNCLYCSRNNRHLRPDQRVHMSLEVLETALDSLSEWPGRIGIIGGEPLLHPQFLEMCELIRTKFSRDKMQLWTSGGRRWEEYKPVVTQTFRHVAYNEHNEEQKQTCLHQPLTVSIKDAIPDARTRAQLIADCWVQRTWCPTITPYGAYFCEVAAAQDILLNRAVNAWPTAPEWWRKDEGEFQNQVALLCENCGMAIPMNRELIRNPREKFSPGFLALCKSKHVAHLDDDNVEVCDHVLTNEELVGNVKTWSPGNYRGDLRPDETAPEGRGFTRDLIFNSSLRLEVITMWYNESFLAPFFLEHYKFADKIHLLYDEDTTDNTLEIVSKYANVHVIPFRFPDMMDDVIKAEKISSLYSTLDCDWAIMVDADEFVFPLPLGRDIREALEREADSDLIYAQIWQVYRSRTDEDLDPAVPAVPQRRHGDPNVTVGMNAWYVKPIVVRPSAGVEWRPGCHTLKRKRGLAKIVNRLVGKRPSPSPHRLYGTHWAMADATLAIERRIRGRRERQSRRNLERNLTSHNHNVTEAQILSECLQHQDDPLLF